MNYEPNYVVGRGSLFFNQFKQGTNVPISGELYFGNTPEFTVTVSTETLDHYSSEEGMRVMDASVLLEVTQGGNLTVDEINADNLALFFLGEVSKSAQTQATDLKEKFALIQRGRFYQLGSSVDNPMGVTNITNFQLVAADASIQVSVGDGDITEIPSVVVVPPSGNYEIDLATGRLYIEPNAPAFAGSQQAIVQYDVAPHNRTMVIGKTNMIYGSLRFVSNNPVGQNKNYFFPKVALSPDGDYALKGDDWQVMSFTFNVLKLNSRMQRVYIDIRDPSLDTSDPTQERTLSIEPASTTSAVGSAVDVTVTVRDGNNNIVVGELVTFSTVTGATVTPTSLASGSDGKAKTAVNRVAAGTATVKATLATGEEVTSSTITFS